MPPPRSTSHVQPIVTVRDLTKRYGRLTALSGVSFSVYPGEVLGLIGPNGSGKTTLFECVAGVLPADSGAVSVDGRVLDVRGRASSLFYLPDAIAPWPAQTVSWALNFTLGYFGGRVERKEEVVERLALRPILESPIGTLSKGERKRAVLAIGLLTPHPVLLVDEPFDGLDLRQSREVGTTLRVHAGEGRTLFLSIHQITDAAHVCDRFVLLSAGRVRGEGTYDELARIAASEHHARAPRDLEDVVLALT